MYAVVPQVVALMCDAISDTGSWDLLGATIVPFCIRSSAVAMGLSACHDSMLYHGMMEADLAGENLAPMLTLSKASSVLALLLADILVRRRTVLSVDHLDSQEGAIDLDKLVQNLTWDLSTLVLKMFAHGQEYRSCATWILLQPLLISLADNPCVTVMLGAVQHRLSRLLILCVRQLYVTRVNLNCPFSIYLWPAGLVFWNVYGIPVFLYFHWGAASGWMHTTYYLCTSQHSNWVIKSPSWELTSSRNSTLGMSVSFGTNCARDW